MDKTIYREQALFGHNSRKVSSPNLSYRKSDLDFNDVFGGPPRRSSLNEEGNHSSYSFDEQISGLREKPVFGQDSPSHRQKLSDDFFDDIFRGDSSLCSTPRKMDQGIFPSSPGSGVLSPKQLSRSGSDLFAGPSSLPSSLSLSTKGAKEIGFPTFGSSTSHTWKKEENALQSSSFNNVSSYGIVRKIASGATNLRTHSLSTTHGQSSLPQQNSCREKSSVEENKSEKQDKAIHGVKNITVLEEYGNCGQFHFSMYKWANKRVSVMMPVRSGTRSSSKELVKNNGIVSVPSANILMKNDLHKLVDDFSTLTASLPTGGKLNKPVDYAEKDLLSKQTQKEESAVKNHNATEKNSTTVREVVKKDDKLSDNQVKGKVREFIKKFNQEISPNAGEDDGQIQVDGRSSSIDNEEEQTRIRVGTNTTVLKSVLGSVSEANDSALEMKVCAMPILEASPENFNTILIDIEEESNCEDFNDLFQVEELCQEQEQNEKSKTNQDQEDIHNHDAEIRKWCYGKEGNIRSLLSTLQYILWPDSGWKPIRLIDIIEGPSVKRAYQRALLCLHPDKLQQKRAAPHQKYIAEKIFDILQEAWDRSNLVSF